MPTSHPRDPDGGTSTVETLFFTDKTAFINFVRFLDAGGSVPADILLADIADGKAINIAKDTPVCIVERLHGGAEVAVASGPLAGKIGWMLAGALPQEPAGEAPPAKDA
jgi:hypothetical protein